MRERKRERERDSERDGERERVCVCEGDRHFKPGSRIIQAQIHQVAVGFICGSDVTEGLVISFGLGDHILRA